MSYEYATFLTVAESNGGRVDFSGVGGARTQDGDAQPALSAWIDGLRHRTVIRTPLRPAPIASSRRQFHCVCP
jgi:hypothetical protein